MPEETPPLIPSRKATEEEKAWHAYRRKAEQEEPKRLEDAAKFLAGMVSITFSILLGTDRTRLAAYGLGWQAMAAVCWLISLLLAFMVLYPRPFRYAKDSATSIEAMHRRVVRSKGLLLAAAVIMFLAGFMILTLLYVGVVAT